MGALLNMIGGMGRPIALGLVILVGLGLANSGTSGAAKGGGFSCHNATSDPGLNRMLCNLSPERILNTPITELLPFLAPEKDKS